MAMKCYKCKGIIPDVVIGNKDRNDCKNHKKPKYDIDFSEFRKFRSE